MIDIVPQADGLDLGTYDTQTERAKNILSVQLGSLEYDPDLGIDLKFFLSDKFKFQNESFKAYLIQVLANRGINVASLLDTVENLYSAYTFNLRPEESSTGLIAR